MVMPISYWKLTDQEIYDYYQQIAAATKLPMMVYNNPATSGVDMSPELIAKMFQEIENICMVKDSTGDIQRMHKFHELTQGKLPFYNGCNPLALKHFVQVQAVGVLLLQICWVNCQINCIRQRKMGI
jgi:4-hydroxy-tetrahydrodipicolinate synthase